jgi:large subunit ribosomal protein L4e
MFAPTKVWRKWHKKINVNQKRYAVASALAASALPALVMSRGHRIEQISEVPLVVDNKSIDNLEKTSKAVALLKSLNAFADVQKSKDSTQLRRGKGKMRNRRYTQRRGPLVVYNEKSPLTRAFRNLPGIQLVSVTRLNLLDLAPGGHLGRFIIWTKDAFQRLDSLYGTYKKPSAEKLEYRLPKPLLTNADVSRVINSDEVQGALRPKQAPSKVFRRKYNPLNNMGSLVRLNPYASVLRRRRILAQEKQNQTRIALVEAKRKGEQQQKGGAPKKVSPKEAKIKKSKVADRKLKKQFYQTLLS